MLADTHNHTPGAGGLSQVPYNPVGDLPNALKFVLSEPQDDAARLSAFRKLIRRLSRSLALHVPQFGRSVFACLKNLVAPRVNQ